MLKLVTYVPNKEKSENPMFFEGVQQTLDLD